MRNIKSLSLLAAFAAIVVLGLLNSPAIAQSTTPSLTGTPTLIVPTTSITMTPTLTASPTEIPTPVPTQKVDVVITTATVGTQYPWNKRIPIKLTVRPTISGSKLEVRWQKKAGLVASPTSQVILNPKAGNSYSVTFTLTPYAIGFQRAVADIIITTNTTNYVASKDIPLQLDLKKTVIPITTTYTLYVILMYLAIFVMFFVLLPFVVFQAFKYLKKNVIPKWLESKYQTPTK